MSIMISRMRFNIHVSEIGEGYYNKLLLTIAVVL